KGASPLGMILTRNDSHLPMLLRYNGKEAISGTDPGLPGHNVAFVMHRGGRSVVHLSGLAGLGGPNTRRCQRLRTSGCSMSSASSRRRPCATSSPCCSSSALLRCCCSFSSRRSSEEACRKVSPSARRDNVSLGRLGSLK